MKEIEEKNKYKDILCAWIRRMNIVKTTILTNQSNLQIQLPMTFFTEIGKAMLGLGVS
jgi:hypothetical protein